MSNVYYLIVSHTAENICAKVYPDYSWKAKLIDFGSSKAVEENSGISGITPQYLPPSANTILLENDLKKVT